MNRYDIIRGMTPPPEPPEKPGRVGAGPQVLLDLDDDNLASRLLEARLMSGLTETEEAQNNLRSTLESTWRVITANSYTASSLRTLAAAIRSMTAMAAPQAVRAGTGPRHRVEIPGPGDL